MAAPQNVQALLKAAKDSRAMAYASPPLKAANYAKRSSKAPTSNPAPNVRPRVPAIGPHGKHHKGGDVKPWPLSSAATRNNVGANAKGTTSSIAPKVASSTPAAGAIRPPQREYDIQRPIENALALSLPSPQKTTTHVQRDDSTASIGSTESPSPAGPRAFSTSMNRSSRPVLRVTEGNVYLDAGTPRVEVSAPQPLAKSRPRMPPLAGAARDAPPPRAALFARPTQQDPPFEGGGAKREHTAEQRHTAVSRKIALQTKERDDTAKATARRTQAPDHKELHGGIMSQGTPLSALVPRHHGSTYGASASKAKKDEVAMAGSDESTEQTVSPAPPKRPGPAATKNNHVGVSKTLLGFIAAPKAPLIPYRRNQQDRKPPAHRISSGKGLPLNFGQSQQPPSTSSPTPASRATPTAVVKAIIASNPRSKPQRYDGFPGVPAYIGAPDVIIFTPRSATPVVSPTTASGRPDVPAADRAQSPSSFSPIVSSSGSDSTRRNDDERMNFLQCWLLSGVALVTSVLPLGLLLLSYSSTPYSSTPRSRTAWTIVGSTTVSRSVFTLPAPTYTRSDVTAVPASCLRSPRQVSDQNPLLAGAASLFTASPKAVIFCLYNNSRYSKSGRYDFGPEQLPLPYCSNIVYWSLGMDDGAIRSRAPQFDLTHGLGVLRQNMLSHGIANATLLVALGGYSEDAPQFSRLGADARVMSRFASSVLYLLRTYHLDGVALHWIGPELGCQGAGDVSTMTRVVRRVRQAILASGYTGLVTLIIPAQDVQSRLSSATVQAVDYIFLETQLPVPALLYSLSHCTSFAAITKDALETVPGYANNKRKICAVYSLAPLLLDTVTFGIQTEYILSNASRYSGVDGKGTIFEMCEDGACLSSPGNMSCIVLKNLPASPDGLTRSYVFYDRETIFSIVTHGDPNKQFVSGDSCLLLYDVDLDNFNAPCLLNRTFNSLHHFHASMERAAHLATPLLAARSCPRS